jgi:inorganic pyrophosphatase
MEQQETATGVGDDVALAFIEIPSGSRNKYELDHESGQIVLDRMLFTSMRYPADYGFIEGTLARDDDPLDVLVFIGEPTFPGCRIRVRPIGIFWMTDEKGPDEKILAVPLRDPFFSHMSDIEDVLPDRRAEIEHFFETYKQLEGHEIETEGFSGRQDALASIAACRERLLRHGAH